MTLDRQMSIYHLQSCSPVALVTFCVSHLLGVASYALKDVEQPWPLPTKCQ